ncbi:hypothetical protein A500_12684 [Clostridium sartagoforme AAU1]|uniref:Uncharacterized protein n=1 Tax=Clostridium sartagoforme AAU1 TaxID=1202534 RepID=R9C641_9CLOT|nr:hypothetical protein A500_12684 [Clostridium sartagoforme AAU1]
MDLKLNIINYSDNISINELNDCLIRLPQKYKDLDTKVIIFDTFSRYIFHSLKHLNFIYFLEELLNMY